MKSWTVTQYYFQEAPGSDRVTVQADHCFVNADGTLVFTSADGPPADATPGKLYPMEQIIIRAFTPRRWLDVQFAGAVPPPASIPDDAIPGKFHLCQKP